MSPMYAQLLEQALRLPPAERGDLAAELFASLEPEAEPDVQAAWSQEIQDRIRELQAGEDASVPWPEARRLILESGDDPAPR